MIKKKKFLIIGFVVFSVIVVFLTVDLVGQFNDIRKRAVVPGGVATVSLSTSETSYSINDIVPVELKFNTAGQNISSMAFRLTYSFSGNPAELTIVDQQGNSDSTPFVLNPNFSGQWNIPVNTSYASGNQINLDVSAVYPVAGQGFSSQSDVLLGTFYLKVNRVPAGGNITLTFNQNESKILTKTDPHDILNSTAAKTLTITNTFSFKVKLQGITTPGELKAFNIWFKKGTNVYSFDTGVLTSGVGGVFSNDSLPLDIQSLASDSYTVLIKDKTVVGTNSRSNHLRKNMGSVIIPSGGNAFDFSGDSTKVLKSGDTNDNNHITVDDIVQILESYMALPVSVNDTNRARDINSDGYISIEDVALALSNCSILDVTGDE